MKKQRLLFAIRITILYFIGGVTWILLSDWLVGKWFLSSEQITQVQTIKGWLFILVSSGIICVLLWLEINRRHSAQLLVEETIRQTEERFRKVFYNSPIAISITTLQEGRFIDANQAYWTLSGLRPETTIGRTVAELQIWKDPAKRALLIERLKREKSIGGMQDKFYTANGEERDTLIFYELIQLDGVDCILSMFHDVTEERRSQAALERRDNILEAIAFAAQHFLRSPAWEMDIQLILERLGRAAEGSRVYLFQKERNAAGQILISQIAEWCAPGVSPQIQNQTLQQMNFAASGYQRWIKAFEQGKTIFGVVRDLPINEQPELVREGILSIICVPIMINKDWWGFIGVDDCVNEREWSTSEVEALSTAASILSSAIQRQQANDALQKQLRELIMLHSVAIANSSATAIDDLIGRITDIIYDTIRPETCGVLLLSADGKMLLPHITYRGTPIDILREPVQLPKGIVGRVVLSGRAARVGDVSQDPDYFETTEGIRSELCVPIMAGKRILGVLNLESKVENAFTEADERLLNTIAGGLATAIEKIELFEATQRRIQHAEKLQEATAILSNFLHLDTLLEAILDLLPQFVPYESATIMLVREHEMEIVAGRNLPPNSDIIGTRIPIPENGFGMFASHRPVISPDAHHLPFFEKHDEAKGSHVWMSVPLIVKDQIIGFLNLNHPSVNTFREEQATLVQTFANQAAVAIENTRFYEETRQRLNELETVSRVSFALRAALDLKDMLPLILWEAQKVVGTDSASIWLYDSESEQLTMQIASGWIEKLPFTRLKPSEGIVGHVYTNRQPYLIQDFLEDPHIYMPNNSVIEKGWSGICLPINSASETIGVFLVAFPHTRSLSIRQIQILNTIAEMAGNAIPRAQLFQRTEEQVRHLTALRDIDIAISSSFDLRVTLSILLDHVLRQLKASAADVFVYNPGFQMLTYQAGMGFSSQRLLSTSSLRLGEGLPGKALIERRDIYVENIKNVPISPYHNFVEKENFVSYYATPLISKGQIKGILEIYFREAFTPHRSWLDFLQALARQATIAIDNLQLFENLQRSNQELSLAYDTTLEGWGKALELRDKETRGHTLRVTDLTLRLARRFGLSEAELTNVRRGVLLHDIGKIAVPDHILKKNGPLTEEEWGEMRQHPQHAYDLLYPIAYLRPALDIPYCHHERWDGKGYPRGLKGEEIPLPARIFVVVDIWDALSSNRPYRSAWKQSEILQYLRQEGGTRLDPRVVEEFLKMVAEGDVH